MLFNKSKTDGASGGFPHFSVTTIPMEFYAGNNPVIKFKNVEKDVSLGRGEAQQLRTDKPEKAPPPVQKAAGLFSNTKFLIFSAAGLFLIFITLSGLYFWKFQKKPSEMVKEPETEKPISLDTNVVTPTSSTSTEDVVIPNEVVVATTTPSLSDPKIEFPSILLGSSVDLDGDGLTDVAEELFQSDAGDEDTDKDGYHDSLEIFHLYSPIGFAPKKLISSSLIKEFTNPVSKYKLYYPANWAVGNVDNEYSEMLFSTITGENIEVRKVSKNTDESFQEWFSKWAPNEKFESLKSFSTVFKRSGHVRSDELVYYFPENNQVYVLVYHTTGSDVVNFKSVLTMMARSFRLESDSSELPDQMIIIQPPKDDSN